jgi:hypothetical protein
MNTAQNYQKIKRTPAQNGVSKILVTTKTLSPKIPKKLILNVARSEINNL